MDKGLEVVGVTYPSHTAGSFHPLHPHSNITEIGPANQIPMSAANQSLPNWANPNFNSTDANTAFSQALNALNPAATQTQLHPPVGLEGGASAPDAHVLGETPQHGYSNHNDNGLGQQPSQRPLDVVAQPTLFEQPRLAQGNPGLIAGGSGAGTSAVAGPTTAGGIGERTHHQWTGTFQWQNDTNVARTQVTAIATKGNPCALFPHRNFSQLKTNTQPLTQVGMDVAKGLVAFACQANSANRPTSGLDQEDQPCSAADPAGICDG